jgi:transcriptional regulator with XRE-family HTH domain
MIMADKIIENRKKNGWSQEELAEKLEISASFLGHIERGTRIASLETLVKLCQALDTDPNYLLAASTSSITRRFPTDMPEETRKQLAALFYQGYQILKSE